MAIICTGDYTITDFNDGISLSAYISSNQPHSQIYNPDNDSYNPSWSSTNLVLTPQLFVTSSASDVITTAAVTDVSWYLNTESAGNKIVTGGAYTISGAKNHILTVSQNVLSGGSNIKYICVISYTDSTTGLSLKQKTDITFTLVRSGSGIATALAACPNGNIFKNDLVSSLTAECDLWRGSVVDITNLTYQWYMRDSSVVTDQGGGIGWRKLTNTNNMYTGVTTRVMTLYPDAVPNIAVVKCIITDTDSTSGTYNTDFFDTLTFVDQSDPVQMSIVSTGGDTFVNGNGSTQLTARLFQNAAEIDSSGTDYTYKWYKYNKDGTLVTGWGGSGVNYKTGKTLTVASSDVDVKSTFRCEVE